ncbi:hypothetical protein K493DRAFT_48602 [Basidiobolus meristosporus CBS 931.73]|uniref:Myb-like domain-containing protein n=1 Tax=Basidiobolus meristosporus CBS 931.73 TaxID=1314790 RepID=A0A1Y1Z4Q6_9FUNG|nr:hypothetical protein K493DRAFT_48602 [Basidiobolus meristosporus CBS 931.73]|eukprot:ORY04805.1 hypothetical protein K493DRAFT_48602 [Basidiobolus meristosporus CBS 931.73]
MSEKDIEPEDMYPGEEQSAYSQRGADALSHGPLHDSTDVEATQFAASHVSISTTYTHVDIVNESLLPPATRDQESGDFPPYQRVLDEAPLGDDDARPADAQVETPKSQLPVEIDGLNPGQELSFDMGQSQDGKPVANSASLPISEDSQLPLESESTPLDAVDVPASDGSTVNSPEVKKVRNRWTPEETNSLINGCFEHGVGAWKKILDDPKYSFVNRTSVDLKDRFRTLFPEEYHRLYHTSMQKLREFKKQPAESYPTPFRRVDRRPKRKFNQEDDENLKAGFQKYGCAWARIVKDPSLNLQDRRSTDLRDRFRTAFPEIYEQLGYAPKYPTKLSRSQASEEPENSQPDSLSNTPTAYDEANLFHQLDTQPQSPTPHTPTQHGSTKGPLTPPPTKKRKKKNIPIRPEHEETVESVYGKVVDAQLKEGIGSDVWISGSVNTDQYVGTFGQMEAAAASSNDQQDQYRKILPKQ